MSEFLPCPFCGLSDTPEVTNARELEACAKFEDEKCECYEEGENVCGLFTVVCNYHKGGCGCTSGWFTTKERAIQRWNERGISWR